MGIGFFAEGKLKRITIDGGPAQTLCDAPSGHGGIWQRFDERGARECYATLSETILRLQPNILEPDLESAAIYGPPATHRPPEGALTVARCRHDHAVARGAIQLQHDRLQPDHIPFRPRPRRRRTAGSALCPDSDR